MPSDHGTPKRHLTRRELIKLSAVAALPLLAACTPSAPPSPTAAPAAPKPAAPAPTTAPAAPAPTTAPAAKAPAAQPTVAAPAAAPTPVPAQPTEAIKRGGTLVQAINWTYPTLDPHLNTIHYLPGYESIYNTLVRFELVDPKTWEHKLVGSLAESWDQPDPKTINFKLKQGIKFHDGSDFDADVAAWNMMRALQHPKSQLKSQLETLDVAEAVDKSTLRIKLKVPNPAFLRSMAFVVGAYVRMASKVAMEKLGEDGFARAPVGTGPFKFKQWITDDRVITERNPDYFEKGADGKPLPYLDGVVFRYVPDPTVSLVDMQAGSVHVLEWVPTKDVAAIRSDPKLSLFEMPWAGQVYFMVGFNTKAPPFDDVRVRQAALQAIDREGMAKALGFGVGIPHYYPDWAPGSLGYDESIPKNAFNPAKVKELLAAAGHKDGISLELKVIAREPENTIGEYVQQMWTAQGIKTKLVSQERLSWIDAVRAMNFQSCFWRGTFVTTVDPDMLRVRITCGGTSNWAQFCDADIDRLMNEGTATTDANKRHEVYRQVLQLIQERAYLGTGISMPLLTAHRKDVQGLTFNYQTPEFRAAWLK